MRQAFYVSNDANDLILIGDGFEPSPEVDEIVEEAVVEDVLEGEQQIAEDDDVTRGHVLLDEVSVEEEIIVKNPEDTTQ